MASRAIPNLPRRWCRFPTMSAAAISIAGVLVLSGPHAEASTPPPYAESPALCWNGLSSAADAEKADQASDYAAAVKAHQESIEAYGDCLLDPTLTPIQHSRLSIAQGHERIFLIDDFTKTDQLVGISDQLSYVALDLLDGCTNFGSLDGSSQTDASMIVGHFYFKYAAQYGVTVDQDLRSLCHVIY